MGWGSFHADAIVGGWWEAGGPGVWGVSGAGVGVGLQGLAVGCGLSETLPRAGPLSLKTETYWLGGLGTLGPNREGLSPPAGPPREPAQVCAPPGRAAGALRGHSRCPGPLTERPRLSAWEGVEQSGGQGGRIVQGRDPVGRAVVWDRCQATAGRRCPRASGPHMTPFGQAGWWP